MITGERIGHYVLEIDEQGDEVLSLDEDAPWRLPEGYHKREVELAVENIDCGHHRADLLINRNTLHEAVQTRRARFDDPPWGDKFKKDPRPFGSVRREKEESDG